MTTSDTSVQPIGPPPTGEAPSQLRRSRTDRVVGGVCGGLGRHLRIDPVLLRIAFVALTLAGGAGVLVYVLAWIVIPEVEPGEDAPVARVGSDHRMQLLVGAGLVAVGSVLLVREVVPWVGDFFWPLVLIAVGVAVFARGDGSGGDRS